jgi:DNA repair protein RadC
MHSTPHPNLREKLRHFGADSLSGQELLAIIFGANDKKALQHAEKVIKSYGKKAIIYAKEVDIVRELTGLPLEECFRTIAACQFSQRYGCRPKQEERPSTIGQPADVYLRLRGRMEGLDKECLYGIYVDNTSRILRESIISIGTLDQTFMNSREIFRPALECNAKGVIIAHNHPSGDPAPSKDDITNTKKLQKFGENFGFPLLDHIIIGYGKYYSILQEKGEHFPNPYKNNGKI